MARRAMIFRLISPCVIVLTLGSCGGSSQPAGVYPYDVSAARLCTAVDTFVNDAKAGRTNVATSAALDRALAQVRSKPGPGATWVPLAEDVKTFLDDAGASRQQVKSDGVRVGHDCLRVPSRASQYAGRN